MALLLKIAFLCFFIPWMAIPLVAVTTPRDVRQALEDVSTFRSDGRDPSVFVPVFAEKLQLLRRRARDFAFGSVIDAARGAREREDLLARARQRTKRAGIPLNAESAWLPERFTPSVNIEYFVLPDWPDWIGARVMVGIPCGDDISLYLWKLSGSPDSEMLQPELVLARESPLASLANSTGTLHFAVNVPTEGRAAELATIETGVSCNSQWRKAALNIVRGTEQPFRQEKLFAHQELAFLGADPHPTVDRVDTGFRFRFLSHFWLDPQQPSRPREFEVRISNDQTEIAAPREEDPTLFLDQWLASPWTVSRTWTTGQHQSSLRAWHEHLSPDAKNGIPVELAEQGACKGDATVFFVHLLAERGNDVQHIYGILRRQSSGFRLEHISSELPAVCGNTGANPLRQGN